jgi:hypothetical protein
VPLDPTIQEMCTSREQAEDSPVLPLGLSEFLTRIHAHNAPQPPHPILHKQAIAFTISKPLYRSFSVSLHRNIKRRSVCLHDPKGEFPKRKISLKSVRFDRPEGPFREMQLDTLFLSLYNPSREPAASELLVYTRTRTASFRNDE